MLIINLQILEHLLVDIDNLVMVVKVEIGD